MDNPMSSGDLSAIIEKLMSDEKFGEMVEAVKNSLSSDDNNESTPEPDNSVSDSNEETPPIPGIPKLSPEIMAKLPEIMSMLSSSGGEKKENSKLDDRKRLLNAMKPFLSEKRRNAVDSIVNIAGFADLFGI